LFRGGQVLCEPHLSARLSGSGRIDPFLPAEFARWRPRYYYGCRRLALQRPIGDSDTRHG
jgi:hypothetical protein